MTGRTLVLGDIHGCDVALETMLFRLNLSADDTLVVLGDVVDRGPDTRRCVELLLEIRKSCRLIFLLGNHEEMMLGALAGNRQKADFWLLFGGREAVDSYGESIDDIPPEHREFLASGLDYWETASEIFVHGNLQPGVPLERQNSQWLRWQHLTGIELPDPSGRRVICGHTSQKSGRPLLLDGWVCIDTFAYGDKYLTCLDVETDTVWQASQSGEFLDATPLADTVNRGPRH